MFPRSGELRKALAEVQFGRVRSKTTGPYVPWKEKSFTHAPSTAADLYREQVIIEQTEIIRARMDKVRSAMPNFIFAQRGITLDKELKRVGAVSCLKSI